MQQNVLFGSAANDLILGLHYIGILSIILSILVIILSIYGKPPKATYET
ncbi:hypothetical protein [Methanobrevibacter sp. 87.7]|nr:hypothetical protein [Methanobrevibacter sp. 87.7]